MKKILLTMTLMTLMTQAFAGILENRSTGETLEFNVNRSARTVEVLSMSNDVENKTIELKSVQRDYSNISVYGITGSVCYSLWRNGQVYMSKARTVVGCLLLPIINIPGLVVGAVETLLLPIKVTLKVVQNMKMKKDFNKLMRAINSTDSIVVSNKRFRRIEKLLK